jgi:hypothetical protein
LVAFGHDNHKSTIVTYSCRSLYMFNKKILAAAVVATFSHSAFAAVDLDASPIVPAVFASETVAASTATTGGAFEIAGTGNVIDVDASVGFGFTANTSFYVRYDFVNAVVETAFTAGDLATPGLTGEVVTLAQGGTEDDSFVIFEVVDADEATDSTDVFTLTNDDLAMTGASSATVQMRIFANAPDAVNQTGALVDKSGTLVTQTSALTTTFTPVNSTTDVARGFVDFLGTSSEASLGSVTLTLSTTALAADDGLAVARTDVLTDATTTLVVSGDFGSALAANSGAVTVDTSATCANAGTAMTVATTGATATLTGSATLANAAAMHVCIDADGTTLINATDAFSATLTPTAGANGTYAAQTGALGAISRNGTTLEFPYITTFSDYNQRILMTNNSATATTYSCTFTPEAGVTATAGADASGSIAGNTTVAVKATDLVTLSGGNRVAARCTLLSQSANIDAATTIVNLSDKSTDTIVIN